MDGQAVLGAAWSWFEERGGRWDRTRVTASLGRLSSTAASASFPGSSPTCLPLTVSGLSLGCTDPSTLQPATYIAATLLLLRPPRGFGPHVQPQRPELGIRLVRTKQEETQRDGASKDVRFQTGEFLRLLAIPGKPGRSAFAQADPPSSPRSCQARLDAAHVQLGATSRYDPSEDSVVVHLGDGTGPSCLDDTEPPEENGHAMMWRRVGQVKVPCLFDAPPDGTGLRLFSLPTGLYAALRARTSAILVLYGVRQGRSAGLTETLAARVPRVNVDI